jgi:ribosome biogenesis SPOUT family RNA methylase Rps3
MTTDTAVRVTRMVIQEGHELENIPYVDFPEIKVDEHESTEMPFRYVKDLKGAPVMPEVSSSVLLLEKYRRVMAMGIKG